MRHETNPKQRLDDKKLMRLLVPSAVLILLLVFEALLTVKDTEMFERWHAQTQGAFHDFVTMNVLLFLFAVLYPAALSLYSLFAIRLYGTPPVYRYVWSFLGIAALAGRLLEWRLQSVFYYLSIAAYVMIIYRVATLDKVTLESKKKELGTDV